MKISTEIDSIAKLVGEEKAIELMEKVRKEESKSISKRLLFFHVVEILYEQGFLREDEKNRMRVILTQIPEKEGACHGTCSNL